jgi:hypothetical protein
MIFQFENIFQNRVMHIANHSNNVINRRKKNNAF